MSTLTFTCRSCEREAQAESHREIVWGACENCTPEDVQAIRQNVRYWTAEQERERARWDAQTDEEAEAELASMGMKPAWKAAEEELALLVYSGRLL